MMTMTPLRIALFSFFLSFFFYFIIILNKRKKYHYEKMSITVKGYIFLYIDANFHINIIILYYITFSPFSCFINVPENII